MFEAPQYAGALPPPADHRLMSAAATVCQTLNIDPFAFVQQPDGSSAPRRELIAHDCALVLLIMQALASEGLVVRT